jgi:hypothetical protein
MKLMIIFSSFQLDDLGKHCAEISIEPKLEYVNINITRCSACLDLYIPNLGHLLAHSYIKGTQLLQPNCCKEEHRTLYQRDLRF